jgi:phosphoserine phosphatase
MEQQTKIAIMYDFDKTLTTADMQEYSFIPELGMSPEEFWEKSNTLATTERMDRILAYMKLMLDESEAKGRPLLRSDLVALGASLRFYPGVTSWFDAIGRVGTELGVEVEHYIISSGLKEIIEGSAIGDRFRCIYASEYLYDRDGYASWPKLAVNYTAKTQFLFRINKGVLDVSEDRELNAYTPESERAIPFRNMVYIGDGLTDVPCMKLVKSNGGKSIAVHRKGDLGVCRSLMDADRIDFFAEADYTEGNELFSIVSLVLRMMHDENRLLRLHRRMAET